MITLILNGRTITTRSSTLAALLHEQQLDPACVASAIDGEFVPRTHYETQLLGDGMRLEVLSPMQGG
ncbi:sulfur carrier protein ThiS [Duffyella gerundensis]|uniref:sulfur carrier protein ThiS n=1 Tax=Duffyella TaxID=3026546 RepID=UPI003F6DC62E